MGCLVGKRPSESYVAGAETVYYDVDGPYIRVKEGKNIVHLRLDLAGVPNDAIIVKFITARTDNGAIKVVAPGYAALWPADTTRPASAAWILDGGRIACYVWGYEPLTVERGLELERVEFLMG